MGSPRASHSSRVDRHSGLDESIPMLLTASFIDGSCERFGCDSESSRGLTMLAAGPRLPATSVGHVSWATSDGPRVLVLLAGARVLLARSTYQLTIIVYSILYTAVLLRGGAAVFFRLRADSQNRQSQIY